MFYLAGMVMVNVFYLVYSNVRTGRGRTWLKVSGQVEGSKNPIKNFNRIWEVVKSSQVRKSIWISIDVKYQIKSLSSIPG